MNIYSRLLKLFIVIISSFALLFTCSKKNEIITPKSIDFPAAYIICADNTISVINLTTLRVDTTFIIPNEGNSFAHHIYKSIDNKKLAVALPKLDFSMGHSELHTKSIKGGIVVLDAKNGSILAKTETPSANHNAVFSKDGKEIWTALMGHSLPQVLVYNSESLALIKTIEVGTDATEIVFSSDGNYAFVAAQEGSFIYVIDSKTKEIVKEIKVDFFPNNVWEGEKRIYVENKSTPSITIIDSETLKVLSVIDLDFKPGFIKKEINSANLWVCNPNDGEVVIFKEDQGAWKRSSSIKTGNDAHAIGFSTTKNYGLVVNQLGNTVSIIDLVTKSKIKDIVVGLKPNGIVLIE